MMLTAWALIGRIPNIRAIGAVILAFGLGLAIGSNRATERHMEAQRADLLTFASEREAAVGAALIQHEQQYKAAVEKQMDENVKAEQVAYALFTEAMDDAESARIATEKRLATEFAKTKQLTESIDGLRAVNKMLAEEFPIAEPPAGCNMPPSVRRAIDAAIARNNAAATGGDPEAAAASVLDGAAPNAAVLTCEQLANGVAAILEHDAVAAALVRSWQAWADQALR